MFSEESLRSNPHLIKAFMGIPSEVFWEMIENIEEKLPEAERKRLEREGRHRAPGAGRKYSLWLVLRVALVLTYMSLHIAQRAVAARYGVNQWDVSRELRRLLPLIEEVLPSPEVWQRGEFEKEDTPRPTLSLVLPAVNPLRVKSRLGGF